MKEPYLFKHKSSHKRTKLLK